MAVCYASSLICGWITCSCSFPFNDHLDGLWKIQQITASFQNIQEQTDVNLAAAFNIFPQKCPFICPTHKTRKGVRLKKPLCWIRGSAVQWVKAARYQGCNSAIYFKAPEHQTDLASFCGSINPANGDNLMVFLYWVELNIHSISPTPRTASHTQNSETSLVTVCIIINYS